MISTTRPSNIGYASPHLRMNALRQRRTFQPHASHRAAALRGLPLATAWQRVAGYFIDLLFAVLLWVPLEFSWRRFFLHQESFHMDFDFHHPGNIIAALIYWGAFNYFGNGRTPGKWIARTRILSLTGDRMGLWQSMERALGYGAAVLELGLGFLQFFWDPNRMCAQDRLAETIVVDTRTSSLAKHSQQPAPESSIPEAAATR